MIELAKETVVIVTASRPIQIKINIYLHLVNNSIEIKLELNKICVIYWINIKLFIEADWVLNNFSLQLDIYVCILPHNYATVLLRS